LINIGTAGPGAHCFVHTHCPLTSTPCATTLVAKLAAIAAARVVDSATRLMSGSALGKTKDRRLAQIVKSGNCDKYITVNATAILLLPRYVSQSRIKLNPNIIDAGMKLMAVRAGLIRKRSRRRECFGAV